ncbi:ComF family protein [Bifidobacterium oedipodis]|nr:phosphoribosyltransferase family protein [Bifidobacterium sp. DSM 109957]
MMPLAQTVARDLNLQGFDARAVSALVSATEGGRSVQQHSAAQRARRVAGHIRIHPRIQVRGTMVIVVDDIVTTGNTLHQSVATLTQAGATVLCALALAEAVSYRDDHDSYGETNAQSAYPALQS